MRLRGVCIALAALALAACSQRPAGSWADASKWYHSGDGMCGADVFYVLSTNSLSSPDADGQDTYVAALTETELDAMDHECFFVKSFFGDEFRFFSPYYHQTTMSSITLPEEELRPLSEAASQEVCDAFDFYFEHLSEERPFILAGFSQGGQHVLALLKHMSEEQYSRCVAAYVMGYRVSEEDLASPHVRAAAGATDIGVTVSFNSVVATSDIWPYVTDGAATCINPVNWRTDSTPAPWVYKGDDMVVHVDEQAHVLVVDDVDPADYYRPALAPLTEPGNLHIGDLLFYGAALGANASERLQAYYSAE